MIVIKERASRRCAAFEMPAVSQVLFSPDDLCGRSLRQFFAELFGTFILVTLPHSANLSNAESKEITTGLSLAASLIIAIYLCGPTSGCHINPALSLASVLSGQMTLFKTVLYTLAQIAGAVCGCLSVKVMYGSDVVENAHWLADHSRHISEQQLFCTETLATFLLALVFLLLSDSCSPKELKLIGPMIIAASVSGLFFAFSHKGGCCMNPAIVLGQTLVFHSSHSQWSSGSCLASFLIGPVLGACVAVLVFRALLSEGARRQRDEYEELRMVLNSRKSDYCRYDT